MSNRLTSLIHANKDRLLELNIFVDTIESSELDFRDEAEQVDLFNETSFARITLFESNRLYIQILNMENENTMYFFDDILDSEVDINEFIMQAIYKMNG